MVYVNHCIHRSALNLRSSTRIVLDTRRVHPIRSTITGIFPPTPLSIVIIPLRTLLHDLIHSPITLFRIRILAAHQRGVILRIQRCQSLITASFTEALRWTTDSYVDMLYGWGAVRSEADRAKCKRGSAEDGAYGVIESSGVDGGDALGCLRWIADLECGRGE